MNILHGIPAPDSNYYAAFDADISVTQYTTDLSTLFKTSKSKPLSKIHNITRGSNGRMGYTVGPSGLNNSVNSLCVHYDSSGSGGLYCGGTFDKSGHRDVLNVALFDGHEWNTVGASSVPSGDSFYSVKKLISYNNDIYAIGTYLGLNNNVQCSGMSKFNGTQWEKLNNNFFSDNAIVFDGKIVFHSTQGGSRLRYFDGSSYGDFDNYPSGIHAIIRAMDIYNDNLIVAGVFGPTVSGIAQSAPHSGIMYFNGGSWDGVNALPISSISSITDMKVYRDKIYAAVYVGCILGGVASSGLLVYDGLTWENFAYFGVGVSGATPYIEEIRLSMCNDRLVINGGFQYINDTECHGSVIWDEQKITPIQFRPSTQFPHVPFTGSQNAIQRPIQLKDVTYLYK